jgi:ComF family protein
MLDLLLPPRCALCDTNLFSAKQPLLCRDCRPTIPQLQGPVCKRCLQPFVSAQGRPFEVDNSNPKLCGRCLNSGHYDQLYSFGVYKDGLAELIQKLKFGKNLTMAPVLGSLLASHAKRHLLNNHYDRVLAIPVHKRSLRKRGFNQAQLLSRYVRDALKISRDSTGLSKKRHTKDQARLSIRQREQNLIGAFSAKRSYHGESCLLVDDVYTTGATAENCARTLKSAGALKVDVLTLARTV